jgi:UDP-N-acetylglucosamine 2-epimerase (non-hydrolysing)
MPEPRHRKILSVVGTRPNFMKTAPVVAELAARPDEFAHVLVHTGQHYDHAMSRIFLEELGVTPSRLPA